MFGSREGTVMRSRLFGVMVEGRKLSTLTAFDWTLEF